MKKKSNLALIGLGNMGSSHIEWMEDLPNVNTAAICDIDKNLAKKHGEKYQVPYVYSVDELWKIKDLEAVVIATPHYDHTNIAIEAFNRGLHVLTEKPVGVHVQDVMKSSKAYDEALKKHPNLLYAAVFQQRTMSHWKKIKELLDSNELGKLIRTTWIITSWFRTQYYYASGGWRATWQGEGGGVLLNQCPHNLDLYQWLVGMPKSITGFNTLGKYHDIEVEDEVTAYFEHENGMVGHFITSTGEAPGTNRLEIVGENGKLVCEGDNLTFYRNRISCLKYLKESKKSFDTPEVWKIPIDYQKNSGNNHQQIIENFANAITKGEKLVAGAKEGIYSVAIGNAILYSGQNNNEKVVNPIDSDFPNTYADFLNNLIKNSNFKKNVVENKSPEDMNSSF